MKDMMNIVNLKATIHREAPISAICAGLVAILFLLFTPPFWLAEEPAIAAHLARGHGFLSPLDPTANAIPTAMSPPLYSVLIAGVYKICGIETTMSVRVMLALNVISAALVAAGIYVLAARCFNIGTARLASVLFLINPVFGRAITVVWHTYPVVAALVWVIIWCRGTNVSHSASYRGMLMLGIALGLIALASPTVVLAYPIMVSIAIGKTRWEKWFKLSAVCLATFCMVLIPWTVRNYQVFGRLFFVRNNFPLEMWVGNQPGATGAHSMRNHPSLDLVERARLMAVGENRYFDECWSRFSARYHEAPFAYWNLTLRRTGMLFIDPYEGKQFRAVRMLLDGLFAALGIAGMCVAWRSSLPYYWLFSILALCSFPYVFTEVNPSYSLPLRIAFMIYGGFGLAALVEALSKRRLGGVGELANTECAS